MADNTRRDTGNQANDTSVESATSGAAAGTPSPSVVRGADPAPEDSGRITGTDARAGGLVANELDITGEFPQPVFRDELHGGEATEKAEPAEESEAEPTQAASPSAQERTSFWLQHLESEVQRLQGKFESLAAELRVRETKLNGLRGQLEAKDALVSDLRGQLDEQGGVQSALRTDLEQANAQIAELIAGEATGEINLAQAEADLQEAREEIADYRSKLGVSERRLLEAQAAATAEKQARERLATEAVNLESRLEELGRLVSARDETISGLEERERQRERSEKELLAEKNDLVGRAAALERDLLQREDDVRIAAEAGAKTERDLRNAQQKIAKLEGLLSEGAREIDELARMVDAGEDTISRLQAELQARHDAAAALERSVRRLAEIDTGIAGLESSLVSTAAENAPSASEGQAAAVSLETDGAVSPSRKMVDAVVGDKPPYPARKVESPIAQPSSSDNQIQPRVSRPR